MSRLLWAMICIGVYLALLPVASVACYSGLALIPTAETVGRNTYSVEAQVDGVLSDGTQQARFVNTQFGFGDRFEAGVDVDAGEGAAGRAHFNAKCLIGPRGCRACAAVGTYSSGPEFVTGPYVTFMTQASTTRFHAGLLKTAESGRWFAGADSRLTDRLCLMADYIAGPENCSSLGFGYRFSDSVSVLGGVLFPNAGGDQCFTFHFVLTGDYTRAPRGK